MPDNPKPKATRLSIREDQAAAVTSSQHGSNLDTIGFNMTFLARHDLALAQQVIELLKRAGKVEESVPGALRSHDLHRNR